MGGITTKSGTVTPFGYVSAPSPDRARTQAVRSQIGVFRMRGIARVMDS